METTENVLNLNHGVIGLCVLFTLWILFSVFKFVWDQRLKKDAVSDKTVHELSVEVAKLQKIVSEFPKMQIDIQRFYIAVKKISGDEWPSIRDELLKEEALSKGFK